MESWSITQLYEPPVILVDEYSNKSFTWTSSGSNKLWNVTMKLETHWLKPTAVTVDHIHTQCSCCLCVSLCTAARSTVISLSARCCYWIHFLLSVQSSSSAELENILEPVYVLGDPLQLWLLPLFLSFGSWEPFTFPSATNIWTGFIVGNTGLNSCHYLLDVVKDDQMLV